MNVRPEVQLLLPIAEGSTPDLVLREAGRLFSAKGFHGTSTREIALAVGIRQPSLFHHFASKTAIAQHLLEYDRLRSPILSGLIELISQPPAVRLYHVVRREAASVLSSRYELRGLYLSDVLEENKFKFWKTAYDRALKVSHGIIVEGMNSGDFAEQDPNLVVELFDAMLTRAVRWERGKHRHADSNAIAALLIRAILRRPARLAAIRKAADRALAASQSAEKLIAFWCIE